MFICDKPIDYSAINLIIRNVIDKSSYQVHTCRCTAAQKAKYTSNKGRSWPLKFFLEAIVKLKTLLDEKCIDLLSQ